MRNKTMMSILGTGSAVADQLISNVDLLKGVKVKRPDGQYIDDLWMKKYFGIQSRSLDVAWNESTSSFIKKPQQEGGLYDSDWTIRAGKKALSDAEIAPDRVDVLIHVSATPDHLHFSTHLAAISLSLGLRSDVHHVHLDLGCAGPVSALRIAQAEIALDPDCIVLLVASHCTSAFLADPQVLQAHLDHPQSWSWLAAGVFGDGGGAMVLSKGSLDDDRPVIMDLWQDHKREVPIIEFPVGGSLRPFKPELAGEAVYVNHADNVNRHYSEIMGGMMRTLTKRWETIVEPVLGRPFDRSGTFRWFLHQANAVQIRKATQAMEVTPEQVPINMDTLGNTSAASTLILFDQERRASTWQKGRTAHFFWLGAHAGAHYGLASLRT